MRPNPLIIRQYIVRGALLWVGVRLLVSAAVALAGLEPLHLTFSSIMVIVGGSCVLGAVDVHRRHERALLENLAVSRAALVVLFAVPPVLGELRISLVANFRG